VDLVAATRPDAAAVVGVRLVPALPPLVRVPDGRLLGFGRPHPSLLGRFAFPFPDAPGLPGLLGTDFVLVPVVGFGLGVGFALLVTLGFPLALGPLLAFVLRDELAGLGVARRQPLALVRSGRPVTPVVVPLLVATARCLVVLGGVVGTHGDPPATRVLTVVTAGREY